MPVYDKLRGTSEDSFALGKGTSGNKVLEAKTSLSITPPAIRYNDSTDIWEGSDDGTTWYPLRGITESAHKTLRHVIHFLDEGPGDGFPSGTYKAVTGTVFPSSIVWWESSAMLKKLVERLCSWTGVNLTTDQWKMYDTDGTTVLATITDSISYSGVFETNRTRVVT